MPSNRFLSRPILGISMRPICTSGSVAPSGGGAIGSVSGSVSAVVVGGSVAGGRVVVVVGGSVVVDVVVGGRVVVDVVVEGFGGAVVAGAMVSNVGAGVGLALPDDPEPPTTITTPVAAATSTTTPMATATIR
jgi:hypothetical protein